MCKVYNPVGSLTALKQYLYQNNVTEFTSVKDVIDFKNRYATIREQLIHHHELLIEEEKNNLDIELKGLEKDILQVSELTAENLRTEIALLYNQLEDLDNNQASNILLKIQKTYKCWSINKQIKHKEQNFEVSIQQSTEWLLESQRTKTKRFDFISTRREDAIQLSVKKELQQLDRKKAIVDKANNYIYGAIGEQKVVKALEFLSNDYILINDFNISFHPALYFSKEDEYIKTIQIDHILVGPAGVFLIETKNWSNNSLENRNLRSPVRQVKRSSFALYLLLHNEVSNLKLSLDKHHWGDKKIPIKNLIALTNTAPKEEFQYVKILTLNEIVSYVNYFKPIFSSEETQKIADFLLSINNDGFLNK